MGHETLNLHEVLVFLFAAGVVVPLVRRLKISPVFGFLLVGIVIGPYGLGRLSDDLPWLGYFVISDLEGVRLLAELGVVFLLFMIGLELSLARLWAMRRRVFGLGGSQILITGAAIAAIAWWFGNPLAVAVVLGGSFALSSTAIVMQLLSENRRMGTETGRVSFAILLCQDLAVLPVLFLVGVFAAEGDAPVLLAFGQAMGGALVAVAVILALGRLVLRPVFRFVGGTASKEMFLALVLLVIIGTALLTGEFGLSMALGAFLAGLLFSETEYRHAIEVDIEPFKGLLLGLFFVSIGMGIDVVQVADNIVWLLASVVGLYLVKSPIIYLLARLFGEPRSVAVEASLLLGQGGEFAFVVVGMAAGLGLMPAETAQFMLIVAGLTMMTTPPVANAARRLAARIEGREAAPERRASDIPQGLSGHVIIVGYGRIGRLLGELLDSQEVPHIGLDNDSRLVARFRTHGAGVFFGDANRAEILQLFGIDSAAALVVTMDDTTAAEQVVQSARQHWPDLPIYARARDGVHAAILLEHGATHVIPETVEASLQLGEMVLLEVGLPDLAARQIIDARREQEERMLRPDDREG